MYVSRNFTKLDTDTKQTFQLYFPSIVLGTTEPKPSAEDQGLEVLCFKRTFHSLI